MLTIIPVFGSAVPAVMRSSYSDTTSPTAVPTLQTQFCVDTVQFSGKPDDRLQLAVRLARLQNLDSSAILKQIEGTLPDIIAAIKATGLPISPSKEDELKAQYTKLVVASNIHEQIADSIAQTTAETHSAAELQQLINIYSDPQQAELINRQREVVVKAMNAPEFQVGMMNVVQQLLDHLLSSNQPPDQPNGSQGGSGNFGVSSPFQLKS